MEGVNAGISEGGFIKPPGFYQIPELRNMHTTSATTTFTNCLIRLVEVDINVKTLVACKVPKMRNTTTTTTTTRGNWGIQQEFLPNTPGLY